MDVLAVEARSRDLGPGSQRALELLEPAVVEGEGVDVEGDHELGPAQQHTEVECEVVAHVDREQHGADAGEIAGPLRPRPR